MALTNFMKHPTPHGPLVVYTSNSPTLVRAVCDKFPDCLSAAYHYVKLFGMQDDKIEKYIRIKTK